MPELLAAILSAREAARKNGATEAELDAIRENMLAEHRQPGGEQEYANQWTPGIAPTPQPKRKPINPGRTTERWYDRF